MCPENFWGDLPDIGSLRTPSSVLREQAAKLGDLTAHVLEGKVESGTTSDNSFIHELNVVAPLLNEYTLTVVTVYHDLSLYPLRLRTFYDYQLIECKDETKFNEALKRILSAKEVRNAIATLLAQSGERKRPDID